MLGALTVLLVYQLIGEVSEQAGAFAGLGMGLNGFATAILMPLMLVLWKWA